MNAQNNENLVFFQTTKGNLIMNPTQEQQEQRAPFYLSGPMLDVIIGGLGHLSYQVAAPVIEDLKAQYAQLEQQVAEQQQAAEQDVPPVPPEPEAPEAIKK